VPEQRHVINAVGTGDHARDQRRDLHPGVPTARVVDPDVPGDQVLQGRPFGELQHRRQARARHEVGIVELGREAVAHSHLPDALRGCGFGP